MYCIGVLLNPSTTYPPTTDPPTTDHIRNDPPTHRPNNHRPTDKIMSKRIENMKTSILQNVNTAGKIENYTSAYYLSE